MTNELEALGEALMALSAQLHRLDTLADARAHEAYERVVDRFNRAWSAPRDSGSGSSERRREPAPAEGPQSGLSASEGIAQTPPQGQ